MPEPLEELEALHVKATAPPWRTGEKDGADAYVVCHGEGDSIAEFTPVGPWVPEERAKADAALTVALRNGFPALAALIRQQQAVIDRLPKTADGVPITPGMLVWENDGSNQIADDGTPYEGFKVLTIGSEHNYDRQRKQWVVLDGIGEVTTDRFYSTREGAIEATRSAAEQAAKEKA